jgi:hypothetical protein
MRPLGHERLADAVRPHLDHLLPLEHVERLAAQSIARRAELVRLLRVDIPLRGGLR